MLSLNTNHFVSGYRGVVLITQAAQFIEILGNTFDGSTAPNMGMGVNTNSSAIISALNDNIFTNIAESAGADTAVGATTGYAVAMGASNIKQAKRNVIHDNDNGVWLGAVANGGVTFDFSADGVQVDRNQLYCNSKTLSGNGYDVILAYANGTAANFRRQPMGSREPFDERLHHDEPERHGCRHGDERRRIPRDRSTRDHDGVRGRPRPLT